MLTNTLLLTLIVIHAIHNQHILDQLRLIEMIIHLNSNNVGYWYDLLDICLVYAFLLRVKHSLWK